ncbi:YHS domain-containing protein [Pedobacter soli]|uniref:YHS domain-containing protein n=1 Tax=Pedobacter soli TaxID=390242 RepID=A0A1G6J1J6_9SPHI|nr:YHS domain-containing protein [Pedobacter soli]SDC12601.1 YHS domain-containing protein [Pedobacter soli]
MKKLSTAIILMGLSTFALKLNANPIITKQEANVVDSTKKVVIDPVCKMKIKAATAKTTVYNKETYYFCSESCKQKFIAEPAKFLKK